MRQHRIDTNLPAEFKRPPPQEVVFYFLRFSTKRDQSLIFSLMKNFPLSLL